MKSEKTMYPLIRRIATFVVLLPAAVAAQGAGPSTAHSSVDAQIRAKLKTAYPTLEVQSLTPMPELGLFEIVSNTGIAYVDPSGDHIFLGSIIDTKTRRNLTRERWTALNTVDFESLPFAEAIKTVHGKGTRQIAVFEDPLCPYCQELETELAHMDDITVYTFLYPLEKVHPGATKKAHELWCTADRSKAWNDWMVSHRMSGETSGNCGEDPIAGLSALGDRLHINSTPTIIFRSGVRSDGLPPKEKFVELLNNESVAVPHRVADGTDDRTSHAGASKRVNGT